MKILLISPLYPPDIGKLAQYTKDVAKRLSGEVSVLTYGDHLERLPTVKTIPVSKHRPIFLRLIAFTHALINAARETDLIFIQNGPSIELPLLLSLLLIHKPIIIRIGDIYAYQHSLQHPFLRLISKYFLSSARVVIIEPTINSEGLRGHAPKSIDIKIIPTPIQKPKILPFETYPTDRLTQYEKSWDTHIKSLEDLFSQYA
jgi:glycosyltransferase involved in cell wall biosynthesis